jgi:hypothetical protein
VNITAGSLPRCEPRYAGTLSNLRPFRSHVEESLKRTKSSISPSEIYTSCRDATGPRAAPPPSGQWQQKTQTANRKWRLSAFPSTTAPFGFCFCRRLLLACLLLNCPAQGEQHPVCARGGGGQCPRGTAARPTCVCCQCVSCSRQAKTKTKKYWPRFSVEKKKTRTRGGRYCKTRDLTELVVDRQVDRQTAHTTRQISLQSQGSF